MRRISFSEIVLLQHYRSISMVVLVSVNFVFKVPFSDEKRMYVDEKRNMTLSEKTIFRL